MSDNSALRTPNDGKSPLQIAVCLSGAERLDNDAFTFLVRNIPTDVAVDCFCFLWEGGPLSDDAALTEQLARKAEGRFRRVNVLVGRGFSMDINLIVQKYPETSIENTLRMFRAIRECNAMKTRHEVERGFTYDCVVRTRSDVRLSSELNFERYLPLTRDFIVFPGDGHYRGGLNDQFAFSSSTNMDAYSSVADYLVEHCGNGCVFHPETLLRFHLLRMCKPVILAPISAKILRG